jgi:hypothetical protein
VAYGVMKEGARMNQPSMETNHVIQLIFGLLFLIVLAAGGFLFANYQRLFGPDPNMPSENSSSRAYTKVQVFVVWVHALILTGAFALLLH